ncbi:MAG: hypothetical protein II954_08855 [Synergistaceae bacterium]|nr:hypothetical protein [Synergistaceae bacterium]
MASKAKRRKPRNKQQRRDVLRKVYYLASFVFLVIRIVLFFWDRYHR